MTITIENFHKRYTNNSKFIVSSIEEKNVPKLKKRFVIPADETIIAYYEPVKMPILSGVEIAFTDRSLYTLIGRKKPLNPRKIGFSGTIVDYDNLCCYIASYDESKCVLFNYDKEVILCKKPVLMRADSWSEAKKDFFKIIRTIQETLIENEDDANLSYRKAMEAFRFIIETSVERCLPLDKEYYLTAIENDTGLSTSKYKLWINDFDVARLSKLNLYADEEHILQKYVNSYTEALCNPKLSIPESICHNRLKILKKLSSDECNSALCKKLYANKAKFFSYYSIHETPYLSLEDIINQHLSAFPEQKERHAFIRLAISLRNNDMATLLDGLLNHTIQSAKEWQKKCDFFGLTALHYAIITNNDEFAMKYIKQSVEQSKLSLFLAESNDQLYDYATLAFLLNNKNLGDYLIDSTGEIAALKKRVKNLERIISLRQLIYNKEKNFYAEGTRRIREAQRSAPGTPEAAEKIAAAEARVHTLKNHLESTKQIIEDLKEDIRELQDQISQKKDAYYSGLAQLLEKQKKSPLYQFYRDPKTLSQYLKEFDKHITIEEVDGQYKINTDMINFDQIYRESFRAEYGKKPYGDSWFSPNAHKNYDVLKKEYRQYAKIYHPDNGVGSAAIFNEISIERDTILERLS